MNKTTTHYEKFIGQVMAARQTQQPLVIEGGNSKYFYGRAPTGNIISTRDCSGIIAYEPTELVITAFAGTPLQLVEKKLAAQGQVLAFEAPRLSAAGTLGGTVASGLSGPARPYLGSVRDYVLGVKCLNGHGQILTFGGQVMKNVAGYDVSRLMTGAMGTLGLLLEISLKVVPAAEYEMSLVKKTDFKSALQAMNDWAGQPLPITASSFDGRQLVIRLAGKRPAVEAAAARLGLAELDDAAGFWIRLRDQQHTIFAEDDRALWRLSVPSATPHLALSGDWLLEWGGALRWLKTTEPAAVVRRQALAAGGHATLFRRMDGIDDIFQPLSPALLRLQQRLKLAFDPDRIFNRGRIYAEI